MHDPDTSIEGPSMHEDTIRFRSGEWEIEGLYQPGNAAAGAVIAHPHPLYGGNMFNPVVAAIAAAYQKKHIDTLRFNFRGVGKSTGTFGQGIGEQADVTNAVAHLRRLGIHKIHLSGYSFGAWVNTMALQRVLPVHRVTMVAPPAAFMDFKDGLRLPMLSAVVAGSRDEIAPPGLVRSLVKQWNPDARIDIIEGADHSFSGFLDEVTRKLAQRI
jgi:alpha/beta superfamily hydrolase